MIEAYVAKRGDLKRFLVARLGNEAEAEDVVQDVYLKVRAAKYAEEIANPGAFLYKVAANLALDHRRRQQRARARDGQWVEANHQKIGAEAIVDQPEAGAAYDAKQRLTRMIKALDGLSPQCRRVFMLHKLEGLSHRQVAARLNISTSTVEKHMNKALKQLVRTLDSAPGGAAS